MRQKIKIPGKGKDDFARKNLVMMKMNAQIQIEKGPNNSVKILY